MLGHKNLIGHLDHEIYFIRPVIVDGESNEDKITDWELIPEYSQVNAKKYDVSGNTTVINDRLTYFQNTEWTIRYRNDINRTMRIVWNTQVYEILNILQTNEGRNRWLKITSNLLDEIYFT
jgi:head-tail adaptor